LSKKSVPSGRRQSGPPKWSWKEGAVDPDGEHLELRYGDAFETTYKQWIPVALVGKPTRYVFPVRWLMERSTPNQMVIAAVREELDFYLVELHERDPWAYALHHSRTMANFGSKVHWSYWPDVR
jgi:hypothetical protein